MSIFGPPKPLAGSLVRSPLNPSQPAAKRRVYFAFHYDDIMRVNNVRNAWKIDHPENSLFRSFYDSSLWESSKTQGDEAVKRLIREGVEYTSCVCVLVGAQTWSRRWVKYEIARSVVDGRGLLAVHINELKHHERRTADVLGYNPLQLLGVGRTTDGQLKIFERREVFANILTGQRDWRWLPYEDYTLPVSLPRYLAEPLAGHVSPLSGGAWEYNFVAGEGHKNLGLWVDQAAQAVGR